MSKERIKRIRAKTGLSQVAFGKRYGIPRRTIEDWETDKAFPPEYLINFMEKVISMEFPDEGQGV